MISQLHLKCMNGTAFTIQFAVPTAPNYPSSFMWSSHLPTILSILFPCLLMFIVSIIHRASPFCRSYVHILQVLRAAMQSTPVPAKVTPISGGNCGLPVGAIKNSPLGGVTLGLSDLISGHGTTGSSSRHCSCQSQLLDRGGAMG